MFAFKNSRSFFGAFLSRANSLGEAGGVEHPLAAGDGGGERVGDGDVALHELAPGAQQRAALVRRADEGAHVVAAREQGLHDAGADHAGAAGDEDAPRRFAHDEVGLHGNGDSVGS
jgi:hypothetical protein